MLKFYKLFLIVWCFVQTTGVFAQGVGINETQSPPDSSAMLDVSSTNKGVLIPRLTTSQQLSITSPATGLLIFNNDSADFMYFDGTFWLSWCHSPCVAPPPKPIANAGPDVTICKGDNTTLSGSCSNCTGSVAYIWSANPPTGNMSNPNISNPVVSPTITTTYTLAVNNGSSIGTDAVVVTVYDVPPIPGPISGKTPVCPLDGDLTYSVPLLPTPPAVTYHWFIESSDTIKNGQGTNSIVVNWWCIDNLPTRVGVYAENFCGFSDTAYLTIALPPPPCAGEIDLTDPYDNKVYAITELGCQCWMQQNINKGSQIPSVIAFPNFNEQSRTPGVFEKYCYSDVPAQCDSLGGLYQWHHALQYFDTNFTQPPYPAQGICPPGWHIPDLSETQRLHNFVNFCIGQPGDSVGFTGGYFDWHVGDKLKRYFCNSGFDCNASHFSDGNPICYTMSGFFYLFFMGGAMQNGGGDYFWTANRTTAEDATVKEVGRAPVQFSDEIDIDIECGFPVRCMKD